MHHGACVTRVPWCMSGWLTRGGGENLLGACATRNFTYLARSPWSLRETFFPTHDLEKGTVFWYGCLWIYSLYSSYKNSSMSSTRHCTWPSSIWKRHSIVNQDVSAGGLFASCQRMHENARSWVRVGCKLSKKFSMKVGLHQGFCPSLLLFIAVLEVLSQKVQHRVYLGKTWSSSLNRWRICNRSRDPLKH